MNNIGLFSLESLPLEMHRVRIVQKLNLIAPRERLTALQEAGNNTFLLKNRDVFLDMLTDSGVNAMSDEQLAAMMRADDVAFVRMEAGTNLIGGQPFSLENLRGVAALCRAHNVPLVLDASLLGDNLHFIKTREAACSDMSVEQICRAMAAECDIVYFSGRKLGAARGGGICTNNREMFEKMRALVPLFEGFLTYGGMSVREMEAMAVGLIETLDEDNISQGPQFIGFMTQELLRRGVPVVTPAGGLGCHLDAKAFLPHVPQQQYPAGALAAAIFLAGGIRGMERGTLSEQRDENGVEPLSNVELVRLALPRRVFTMSQVLFAVDRIAWLFEHRDLIGGLRWTEEPEILRFFYGRLAPVGDWQEKLLAQFEADFPGCR